MIDDIQRGYKAKATELQKELIAEGFMASRVIKGEERCDFYVSYFDGNRDYKITRDYDGNVHVALLEYKFYSNVSSHARSEVYKKHRGQNVKVITQKKLQAKIDEVNAIETELAELEAIACAKVQAFIDEVKKIEAEGIKVDWNRNHYKPTHDITGGSIERNGCVFSFEIGQDGYVSKKITISHSVDYTLEDFMRVSSNKY